MLCWHATSRPQYGRVWSGLIKPPLITIKMDANHPIGGKVVDQCVPTLIKTRWTETISSAAKVWIKMLVWRTMQLCSDAVLLDRPFQSLLTCNITSTIWLRGSKWCRFILYHSYDGQWGMHFHASLRICYITTTIWQSVFSRRRASFWHNQDGRGPSNRRPMGRSR